MRRIDPAASAPLWLIAILAAVTATGPFAMQIFLPALPAIQTSFGVSAGVAQPTLSVSMIAIALATLIYGPLSDRFGRRPTLLLGLGIFLFGSLLCVLAHNVEMLIAARVIQAAGGAAGMVIARAVARDHYGPQGAANVIARLTIVMVVAPMVAPAIGGFIVDVASWRVIFGVVAIAGVVVVAAVLLMFEESHRAEDHMDSAAGMLRGFAQLLGSKRFIAIALYPAFSSTIFFAFISGAPYVMVELLHRPATEYGLYFILVSAGFMTGDCAAVRFSGRFDTFQLMRTGMLISLAGMVVVIVFVAADMLTPLTLFVPVLFTQLGQGLGMPNAQAAAINVFPLRAGTASALTSFSQMLSAAAASQIVGILHNGTPWPLLFVMLFGVLGALTAVSVARTMH
jgi:DHA1 family bicyclomycin/chloramphenicol resistance-like MFS transporter